MVNGLYLYSMCLVLMITQNAVQFISAIHTHIHQSAALSLLNITHTLPAQQLGNMGFSILPNYTSTNACFDE